MTHDWLIVLLSPIAQMLWWTITEPLLVMVAVIVVVVRYASDPE